MSNEDVAYLAGLFDGEGTVTLGKGSNPSAFRRVELSVSSTDRVLCEFFKQTFKAGYVRSRTATRPHWKDSFEYRISGTKAIEILRKITPFLKCPNKVYRSNMILSEFEKITRRNGKYSLEERKIKQQFEKRFFEDNH